MRWNAHLSTLRENSRLPLYLAEVLPCTKLVCGEASAERRDRRLGYVLGASARALYERAVARSRNRTCR